MEAAHQAHKDNGLVIVTLMGEDLNGGASTLASLQAWAAKGATYWIVASSRAHIETIWPSPEVWGMDKLLKPGIEVVQDYPVDKTELKPQ